MKVLAITIFALALVVSPAMADQCPMLMGQLRDAVGSMNPDDAKAKARVLVDEVQRLCDRGDHAQAMSKAEDVAKILGFQLKNKM